MKRVLLSLLGILVFTGLSPVAAQVSELSLFEVAEGLVTELAAQAEGLAAQAEVLAAQATSLAGQADSLAARERELDARAAYLAMQPPPAPAPLPPPVPAPVAEPQPVNITIHNYIIVPDDPPQERYERPRRQNRRPKDTVCEPAPMPPTPAPAPPAHIGYVPSITVLPRQPNADSNRVYSIQVGAFRHDGTLYDAKQRVEAAGLTWTEESRGDLTAVLVRNVHSSQMNGAIRSLASAGFRQVWIWEPQ